MKDNLYTTKCPFCNSDAWIQTGIVSIEEDISSIRMICTNVHCKAIIKTEYDSKLYGLAYMGLLYKIKELRENPDKREKIIKYQFCPNRGGVYERMMTMTVEEIKNQLEDLIKDRESFMVGDYDKDIYDRDKEALEFAVKAVEKQIPKKVKREFLSIGGAITCFEAEICPSCGKNIYDDEVEVSYNEHCPECGQALDWSDEDE